MNELPVLNGFNLLVNFSNNFSEVKDEFASDDEIINPLDIELSDSDLNESPKVFETKRNKRKALVPQRAIQADNGDGDNASESSQDSMENKDDDESANLDYDAFYEESIFKDIKEEAGDDIDEKLIQNVKDEWKRQWGIKCNMCEKLFSYRVEFDAHYRNSYNREPVYTCSFCDRTLEKYATFRSHCYRHVTEGRYKCQHCSKGFSLQNLLCVHVMSKHSRARPYNCEECGKSFVTKPGLRIHAKKHKTEVVEDYPCIECGKVLHTRGGLTSHMNVHRLGRRFMCDICGKTFTQKVNMQQHVKQHTGDKPFECNKCGKTFAEKSHLSRHYSFHSEQRPFKCKVCDKMYKTERCLKVHSMVHAKERPFICTHCQKGFLSSTKLKQHLNIHTGARPYSCNYCERTFTNYPNWLKHTRRRHNVDHKTGENLPPKAPKQSTVKSTPELPATPPTPIKSTTKGPEGVKPEDVKPEKLDDLLPHVEPPDTLLHDSIVTDFKLSKSDELLLQQGLLNFPVSDDKLQTDLFTPSNGNFFSPCFSNPLQMPMILDDQSNSQLQVGDYTLIHLLQ